MPGLNSGTEEAIILSAPETVLAKELPREP